MKRIFLLAVLMMLSPSAHAGSSISFSVGGHRIHIEASSHCRSTSCASVSVSGIYDSRRKRDRFDDDDATPAKPASPAPQLISPPAPPANIQPAPTVVVSAPPAVYKPAAVATQTAAAPPPPPPVQQAAIPLPPPPPVQQVAIPVPPPPAPIAAPQISRVSHEVEQEAADTPVGDWQTEGKGAIRITRCGNALCGYVLNSSSDDRGEAVLINMKPKNDAQWTGSVYSHDSGDTYYGTMNVKGANTLRVEACALGRFYCSGNNWSRISGRAESLMTSRQISGAPRS
jgi:Uncharacterized protein conserved in bacteria (DUF2147)